ncbi:MAG: phosphotransferase, partial [bacterium]
GKTLTVCDVCDKAQLPRIVELIKKCHKIPFKKEFQNAHPELVEGAVYDNIRIMMARSLAYQKPFITEQEVVDINDILNQLEAYFLDKEEQYAGLCHCDLLPGNIIDDGAQLWLIDWEYASWGNILFDLASLSIEAQFNEAQIRDMLKIYFGKNWQENYYDFQLVCILFNLRNAFWYDLRGQDLEAIGDVKMADYAQRHLDLFKKESEKIMKTQVYKEIEKILPSQFTKIEGDTCTVWEYDENKVAGFSCSIVNGRYPEVGQVMNTACDLIYFVLSGTGAITYAGQKIELKKGESFFIGKNKEYFIAGQDLFFAMVELPKWTLEQYKKID